MLPAGCLLQPRRRKGCLPPSLVPEAEPELCLLHQLPALLCSFPRHSEAPSAPAFPLPESLRATAIQEATPGHDRGWCRLHPPYLGDINPLGKGVMYICKLCFPRNMASSTRSACVIPSSPDPSRTSFLTALTKP